MPHGSKLQYNFSNLAQQYLTCLKVHVALSSTQPNVSKQHISQSGTMMQRGRCHIVGPAGADGIQGDSPDACKEAK